MSIAPLVLFAAVGFVPTSLRVLPSWRETRSRAPPVVANAPEFIFDISEDRRTIKFGCRQKSTTLVKPEVSGTLQEFIGSSAASIVESSWDAGQVKRIDDTDEFLINVEEFDFVVLKVAVELRVCCTLDARTTTAKHESLGFRLIGPGLDQIADTIDVRVAGALTPTPPESRICALAGDVEFFAEGALPAVLASAPDPALRAAARAMSESLIGAAQERFAKRVPDAYRRWAATRSK